MDEICRTCGATLQPGDKFCPHCGAQATRRAGRSKGGQGRVVAVVIGVATLAVALGVLFAFVVTRPTAGPPAAGSSAPSPSATADVGASSEPSISPSPSATPTAGATDAPTVDGLGDRAVAEVGVAGLNLRREPGRSSEVRGTLDVGARLFVIGAPQAVDGIDWYRVAVVDGPYSGCAQGGCPSDIGWVAEGVTPEDAWLRPVELDCPSSPMTAEQLDALRPLERLSCYGRNDIVVTGTLDVCYCDANAPLTYEPAWLALPIAPLLFHETFMFIRFEEDPPTDLEPGDVVRATLAMEHDAASTCIVRFAPGFSPPAPSGEDSPDLSEPDRAETVLGCRTELVMKSYEVIGTEDVSLP